MLVVHREGKGSHAIGGEYFLARARGGSRAEEGLRRGGPQGGGARPSLGEVACERRKRGRKRRKARRAVRALGPPPSQREGGAVRRFRREIAVTRGLGRASEERAECGKRGR